MITGDITNQVDRIWDSFSRSKNRPTVSLLRPGAAQTRRPES